MANQYSDDETAVSTSTATPDAQDGESSSSAAAPVGEGPLLEKDPPAVMKLMDGFWDESEPFMGEPLARWKANEKRREGVIGVHIVKPDPDRAEWKVWAPPGAARVPPTFNKPARLGRRLVSNLFVDPPLPEVTPGGASDSDKPDAAEFQTRILQDVTTSSRFNVAEMAEEAVDKAVTFDSGFVRVYIDPKGGGSRPKTIQASEAATTVRDALYVDGDGETPQKTPYVTRYVKPAGEGILDPKLAELTDDPRLADREWLPALRREILTGRHIRPIPATATSIEECLGVIIRTPARLGDLRSQYPEALGELSNEDLWELVSQRPAKSDSVLNPADRAVRAKKEEDEPPPDETTVIVTMVYMDSQGSYPAGAYVIGCGTKYLLHRQKWEIEVNGVPESLTLPIAHFKGWSEGKDTFWGFHLMHFLGPGQEVRAAALGGAIEHLDRFNRRKTFYTPQSLFQAKMGPAAMGVMVPIQQGSQPKVEDFPEFPRIGMEIMQLAGLELDDESGLAPILQGQTDPTVQSGLHAQKIIEQANIGLSQIKRSTTKGIERLWNISAAFIRGYFTVSQQIRYRGDDQEYKHEDWTSADLTDAKDVRILKGSFSMLAPSAKLAVAEYARKLNLIDDSQLRRLASGNIGGLMGLQDDPALLRIRRQIALWEKGPPKAESPAEPMPDAYPGETAIEEPQMSPVGGRIPEQNNSEIIPGGAQPVDPSIVGSIPGPVGGPPAPPAPDPFALAGAQVFKPVPNDEEPSIAAIRFQELSRSMCSKKFERQPDPWQQIFIVEYSRMRLAAGVGTAAEAAANQQAAQKAAQDAETQKLQQEAGAEQSLQTLKDQHALELEKLRLEHASVMKELELQAQSGADVAGVDLEKKRMELEQKADIDRAKLDQDYKLAVAKMKQEAAVNRQKSIASGELEVKKTIKIERNAEGVITGAEIIPEEPPEEELEPAGPVATGSQRVTFQRDKSGRVAGAEIVPETEPVEREA